MYKAKLTKAGARRIGMPELEGKTVAYDKFSQPSPPCGKTVERVFYKGEKIASNLAYAGNAPGLEIIEWGH